MPVKKAPGKRLNFQPVIGSDPRRQLSDEHEGVSLLHLRLRSLALGYEDLNDHWQFHQGLAIQTVVQRENV